MKTCTKCKDTKLDVSFPKNSSWCKLCKNNYAKAFRLINKDRMNKERRVKYTPVSGKHSNIGRYNLTLDDYNIKLEKQKNLCAICINPEDHLTVNGNIRALCIDHNHNTNKVRDLLCNRCNRVIGLVKENKQLLKDMISYLETHE